mmetsp:Transcript_25034/g.63515  ORF Transcript_25034/g.63515 Transcript_25034/m.63515 type:complete len:208 (-) Transcript_25034:287-910(-)
MMALRCLPARKAALPRSLHCWASTIWLLRWMSANDFLAASFLASPPCAEPFPSGPLAPSPLPPSFCSSSSSSSTICTLFFWGFSAAGGGATDFSSLGSAGAGVAAGATAGAAGGEEAGGGDEERTGMGMARCSGSCFLQRSRHSRALTPTLLRPPPRAYSTLNTSRQSPAALAHRSRPSQLCARLSSALTLSGSKQSTSSQSAIVAL